MRWPTHSRSLRAAGRGTFTSAWGGWAPFLSICLSAWGSTSMANSRFVAHVKWWFFIVPIIAVFVMPAVPDKELFEIPEAESQSVVTALGEAKADTVVASTNALFKRTFVQSGLVRASLESTRSGEISDGGVSEFAHNWVRNFWLLVYRVIYRATV